MVERTTRTTTGTHARRFATLTLLLLLLASGMLLDGSGKTALAAREQRAATIDGCPVFPVNNVWNQDISALPVHPNSANFVASIGLTAHMHADFGSGLYAGGPIGIPYVVVSGNQPTVPVSFDYAGESDPGPYPLPPQAPVEGGAQSSGDRHVIVINSATCKLYELFAAYPQAGGSWKAGSGATWDLNSNALRPQSWTSGDAAGLPMLPGLARYDEIAAGAITHALRVTVERTQKAYIWPARHFASADTDPNLPPMGLRLRLKASVNIAAYPPQSRIVLAALQHYGMIVADNGANWFVSGAPDDRWNNDDLSQLRNIQGSDFEVVDESSLQIDANSAQARTSAPPAPAPSTPTVPSLAPTATTSASTPGVTMTSTSTHAKVTISMSAVTPLASLVSQEQRKKSVVNRSSDKQNGQSTLLPIAGSVVVLLLLAGAWLHLRRPGRAKHGK